jgi:hypothetical protein
MANEFSSVMVKMLFGFWRAALGNASKAVDEFLGFKG